MYATLWVAIYWTNCLCWIQPRDSMPILPWTMTFSGPILCHVICPKCYLNKLKVISNIWLHDDSITTNLLPCDQRQLPPTKVRLHPPLQVFMNVFSSASERQLMRPLITNSQVPINKICCIFMYLIVSFFFFIKIVLCK